MAERLKYRTPIAHESGWASVDAVYADLDRYVARQLPRWKKQLPLRAVYAYEDAALKTFRAAKREGLTSVYDLPIAYWKTSRRLLEEQAARLPRWERTLVGTRDSDRKLERKTKEIAAADIVVCPSKFVLDSIPAEIRRAKRCVVAEFGTPSSASGENPSYPGASDQKLRVLFVGSMSQRKGLADLFLAVRGLKRKDVELVVMGSPVTDMEFYRSEYADFTYEAPRPHADVLKLMASCHVLCLPSIVEGRALVQQEAMSRGLPLIVTPNAGAEDLVSEGETGFLVPPASPDLLRERIEWCADHPRELREMGRAAAVKAAQLTWERYAKIIIENLYES
jgi:glycosyltransferase involved in cell wall biosynthesis